MNTKMSGKSNKITLLSFLGSVLAGLLASLCCIGPLVFIFLGISGAAFFTKFEEYRWPLGILAVGFLAVGFFFTYRGGECAPGSSCAVNPGRKKLNKILLWISSVLVAALIFSPDIIGFLLT
ncbi:MAG: mercuric transporter MerT family protein [Deltaproteobacteria bacterium]